MLNLIKWVIKAAIFSILVIVIANWVHWRGKTISDQVRTQIAHAERSGVATAVTATVHNWAGNAGSVTRDARHGVARKPAIVTNRSSDAAEGGTVEFPSSERQKLRALIRELNTSPGK